MVQKVRVMGLELGVDQHLCLDHIGTHHHHHHSCVRRASLTSTSTTWTSATLWPSAHADRSEAWYAGTSRTLHSGVRDLLTCERILLADLLTCLLAYLLVCSTMATHMVPTLGRSGSVRGIY